MPPLATKRTLAWSLGLLSASGVLVTATSGHTIGDIPAGTGYAAADLCSRTLQSRQSFDVVRERYVVPRVTPLERIWEIERGDGKRVAVRTRLPALGHERVAVFRPGRGCTVVPPGASIAQVESEPFRAAPEPPLDARPWPLGEGASELRFIDGETERVIRHHAALIFRETAEATAKHENATALLVAKNGHLVYERYEQGMRREQPQLGWSMTKTLTALLAGVLAGDGKLALDAPVGLPAWQGTDKARISWRALLNMAPGLAWDEGYGGASDATEMLFSQPDQGAWAAARPLTSEPGAVFTYSTGFSNIAMLRMKQLLGGTHQAIYDYYQSRLFAPLGMRGAVIEADASGTPVGGARGFLRPVDWLRLGQLVANRGQWHGKTVVPASHIAFMTSASPASPEYGGSIWRRTSEYIRPDLRTRLPDDLVWFAGFMEQIMVVVPSEQLVVLRMGVAHEHGPARDKVFELVADLLDRR